MQIALMIAQFVLALCNICIMVSIFAKFVNRPHDTLEKRITALEVKAEEHDRALKQGNDRFRDLDDTNEVMQICMLALIDFEVNYCSHTNYEVTDDLIKAKNTLRDHLARKRQC